MVLQWDNGCLRLEMLLRNGALVCNHSSCERFFCLDGKLYFEHFSFISCEQSDDDQLWLKEAAEL